MSTTILSNFSNIKNAKSALQYNKSMISPNNVDSSTNQNYDIKNKKKMYTKGIIHGGITAISLCFIDYIINSHTNKKAGKPTDNISIPFVTLIKKLLKTI